MSFETFSKSARALVTPIALLVAPSVYAQQQAADLSFESPTVLADRCIVPQANPDGWAKAAVLFYGPAKIDNDTLGEGDILYEAQPKKSTSYAIASKEGPTIIAHKQGDSGIQESWQIDQSVRNSRSIIRALCALVS